jgi:hypothetical protein
MRKLSGTALLVFLVGTLLLLENALAQDGAGSTAVAVVLG